jgi:CrcB protein
MSATLTQALYVGAGGFLGAILRFALGGAVHRLVPMSTFPWGTLAVNTLGCLLIGFLAGVAEARQVIGPELRLFLLIGLLGGFTTFSTFGFETMALMRSATHMQAMMNIASQVILGLFAVWGGLSLSRLW